MTLSITQLVILTLTFVGAFGAVSHGTVTITVARPDTLQHKFSHRLEDLKQVTRRIPKALVQSVGDSAKTFVSSSSFLIPVNLALTLNKLHPMDQWLLNGVYKGADWAKTSAVFVGAETFIGAVRNKQDKLNRQLASGVSSGLMKINDGPVAMTQGFCLGFGLMYTLDTLMPNRSAPRKDPPSWMRRTLRATDAPSDTIPAPTTTAAAPVATSPVITTNTVAATPVPTSNAPSTCSAAEVKPKVTSIGRILRSFKLGK